MGTIDFRALFAVDRIGRVRDSGRNDDRAKSLHVPAWAGFSVVGVAARGFSDPDNAHNTKTRRLDSTTYWVSCLGCDLNRPFSFSFGRVAVST